MPDPTPPNHMPIDAGFEQAFECGVVFDGKYRVDRLLGAGAFGRVYLADDVRIGRCVALKVVDVEAHPEHASLLQTELEVVRGIEHSHVVRLYDFGSLGRYHYLSMEYVEGPNLSELIHQTGRFDLRRAATITLQILDALVETQKDGMAHLDLKPQNVIITRKGAREDVVKLIDFGIARSYAQDHHHEGMTSGTPLYMAPEQVQNHAIGPYTDVYAVGLIFFEMLTGYPAFVESDAVTLMAEKASVSVRVPQGLAPSPVCAVIDRALRRAPHERYPHAFAMFEDLRLAASAIRPPTIDASTGTSWRKIPTSSGISATVTGVRKGAAIDPDAQTDVSNLEAGETNLPAVPSSATALDRDDEKPTDPSLPLVSMRRRARRPQGRRHNMTPPLGTKRLTRNGQPGEDSFSGFRSDDEDS